MSGSNESIYEVWIYVVQYIQEHFDISEAAMDMWIGALNLKSIKGSDVLVEVKTEFQKSIIDEHYAALVQEAFSHVLGFPVTLRIVSNEHHPNIPPVPADDEFGAYYFFNRMVETGDYTFENFIVGSSNNFAHAAALAVATHPSGNYNPLFIYGSSGLGKTHLLYAIAATIRENNPNARVMYTRCEEMTNDFIRAVQKELTFDEFRKPYRMADILLVDDIQFLAGKERMQDEFFYTFDYLHNAGRQIVLTSDRPPSEIATLKERLRTRFEMGLLADIQAPDYETRVAIVRRKAFLLKMDLPNDVCEYLATQLKTNVRQLEGAVKTIHAQYMIGGNAPTVSIAQSVIRDMRTNQQPTPVTIERIATEVARTFNVTVDDIFSKSRTAPIPKARQVAFYVTRSITGLKQEDIGREFGGFDHSTVVYALHRVDQMMRQDPTFRNMVNDIVKNLSDE
ncbi:MAG: chromosomal replication initiator protein DnaA [Clostridia bacterium]|nr:chromosomal replication initiator protein DnaA [Clostridia bacterium]